MGYFIALVLLVAFLSPVWLLWRMYQRQHMMATRLSWLESVLKQQGIRLSNDDYVKFCYLTEGYDRAVAEYGRIYHAPPQEARKAVTQIEAELKDSRSAK
jgi:hypothetical protein